MAKHSNLHVHPYSRSAEVPLDVLESVVNGTFDKSLSEQEASVLAAALPNNRQWFEAFVQYFYVKIRHIVKQSSASEPSLLEQLMYELLPPVEGMGMNRKVRKPLREKYSDKQNMITSALTYISRKMPFEQATADKIREYSNEVTNTLAVHYSNHLPFSYMPTSEVVDSLRAKVLN